MDLTGISIDLSDYIEIATFLAVTLVSYWAIMKGIELWGSKSVPLGWRRLDHGIDNDEQYERYLNSTQYELNGRRRTWY